MSEQDYFFIHSVSDIRNCLAALRASKVPRRGICFGRAPDGLLELRGEALGLATTFFREFSSMNPRQPLVLIFAACSTDSAAVASLLNEVVNQVVLLCFVGVRLVGGSGPLVEALRKQKSLNNFAMRNSVLYDSELEAAALVLCLSALPAMRIVSFDQDSTRDVEISDTAKVEMATSLARINGLVFLKMMGMTPAGSDLQGFFASCTALPSLKRLDLISDKVGRFSPHRTSSLSVSNAEYAIEMLRRNASIKEFCMQLEPDVSLASVAAGLETNSTLRDLTIGQPGLTRTGIAPFLRLLKDGKNYTLESLSFVNGSEAISLSSEIEFYLQLNQKFQRKVLMSLDGSASRQDWVNTIIFAREETAVVFYYLSENVSLLLRANDAPLPSVAMTRASSLVLQGEPANKRPKYE
jgi:hypothetical protein